MSGDIVLSAALRNNLLSLQSTQRNIDTTQLRLATGLKVNSALDNPQNFFTARALNNRASDLTRLLDGISQSIRTIEQANTGVESLSQLLDQADSIATEAQSEIRASEGFSRARGNEDLANVPDLTLVNGGGDITAGDQFDVTVTQQDGTTNTVNITIAAGENIDDVISAINTEVNGAGTGSDIGEVVRARLTDSGNFEIASLNENASIRLSSTGQIELEFSETVGQVELQFDGVAASTPSFGFGGTAAVAVGAGNSVSEQFTFDGVNPDVDQFEEDFNNVRDQIDQLVEDSNYRGVNLLSDDDLTTFFNEDRDNTLTTEGVDFTALGLGIAEGDFTNANNVQQSIDSIREALSDVRNFGQSIANDLSIVQFRRDFTEQTINTLQSGADDLVVADQNEEGANLLALQTRQALGTTSLSLAAQSQQAVLRLF